MSYSPQTDRPASARRQKPAREIVGRLASQFGMVLAFVFLVIVFSLFSRSFFTLGNFTNIANQTATVSVIAFGMTMVMLSGGIDLSVGSIVSLSAVVCAIFLGSGVAPLPAMLVVCLGVAGLTFWDVMGREAYRAFMMTSVVTFCAVAELGMVLELRRRRAA